MRVSGVDPVDLFRWLGRLNLQINDNRILTAADKDTSEILGIARVDLLMGYEWRYVNAIAWPCLGDKLEVFAPSHTCTAADDVNDAFQFPMGEQPSLRWR
jgi:hypothetical protein